MAWIDMERTALWNGPDWTGLGHPATATAAAVAAVAAVAAGGTAAVAAATAAAALERNGTDLLERANFEFLGPRTRQERDGTSYVAPEA